MVMDNIRLIKKCGLYLVVRCY